jgi:tryptophan synthase beta chain
MLAEAEGIIPALESAHAVGMLHEVVKRTPKDAIIILNVSGRGDKDVAEIARIEGFALNS